MIILDITNKTDFLEDISYKSDIEYKQLRDLLWKKIYQSTRSTKSKENCNN
jgi:hypothetical protein